MGTMTKWPVQKHTEHHKTRSKQERNGHKEITIFCVFPRKMLETRKGRVHSSKAELYI